MFANNNHEVVRRLALRSLTAHKKRNMIAAATIALAVCVMLVLSLTSMASYEVSYQKGRGFDQAYFSWINEEELAVIQNHPELADISVIISMNTIQLQDAIMRVSYISDNHYSYRLDHMPLVGNAPKSYNEIAVQGSMLHYLGYPLTTGQEESLDLGYGPESFIVSGYLDNKDESRGNFPVFVSKKYMETHVFDPLYSVRINLRGSEGMELTEVKAQLERIAQDLGLEENITIRDQYFGARNIPQATFLYIPTVFLVIAFACGIVIYSMFYITVSGKTQEYGRLKVIGATSKMLRRIVRIETLYLSAAGIVGGNLIGCILSYLLVPEGWRWPVTGICVLLVSLLAVIAVCISTRTPVKLAGKVAPIEAVKISPYTTDAGPGETKQLLRNLTPPGLAWIGFRRNPKKAVLTFCSLGLAGVILMCVAAFQSSISEENMVRTNFPYGEYSLELNMHNNMNDTLNQQRNNPLDENLKQALYEVDGVSSVMVEKAVRAEVQLPNREKTDTMVFTGLSRNQLEEYDDLLVNGTTNYDELTANNGMVIDVGSCKTFREVYHVDIVVGTQFDILCSDGSRIPFTVMGITSSDLMYGISATPFSIPEDLMSTIDGNIENFNAGYKVMVEEDNEEIRKQLFAIANSSSLEIISMQDQVQLLKSQIQKSMIVLYGLAAFIGLFSLINLANTLITNLISRQQELGIYQSIGMSNIQLKSMLRTECLVFIAGAVLITSIVGSVSGFMMCSVLDNTGWFGIVEYRFPYVIFGVYITLLLAVYVTYVVYAVKFSTKRELVERITIQ